MNKLCLKLFYLKSYCNYRYGRKKGRPGKGCPTAALSLYHKCRQVPVPLSFCFLSLISLPLFHLRTIIMGTKLEKGERDDHHRY
jgi:hypothetical protein